MVLSPETTGGVNLAPGFRAGSWNGTAEGAVFATEDQNLRSRFPSKLVNDLESDAACTEPLDIRVPLESV
jgi:hypothetical protein